MKRSLTYLLGIMLLTGAIMAQEGAPGTFVRINHSSDETVAVDSTGTTWYYDSEIGEFVESQSHSRADGRIRNRLNESDFGDEDVILPPEIRCTDVHTGDISEFFDQVVVEVDERIEGSVFSVQDVIIKGLVTESVVSFRTVTITGTGEVRGDVIAKDIERERGGRILGQRQRVPFPDLISLQLPRFTGILPGFVNLLITGILIFLCLIVIGLLPAQLGRIVEKVESGLIISFFYGLLVWLALSPLAALLIITIIGIPIAVLILPLAIVIAIILGYVAVTVYLGKRLCPLFGWSGKSLYMKALCGVVVLELGRLLAAGFLTFNLDVPAIIFFVAYGILDFLALTIGIGAVVSSRFGIKPKVATTAPGITPPPTKAVVPPPSPSTPQPPPPPIPPPLKHDEDATE